MNMFKVEERENAKTGRKYLSIRGKSASKEALQELNTRIPCKIKLYEEHLGLTRAPRYLIAREIWFRN